MNLLSMFEYLDTKQDYFKCPFFYRIHFFSYQLIYVTSKQDEFKMQFTFNFAQ